ncbi:hypothetical protein EYC84_004769 [Monilinia fructicola]|uniref:Uncharacterized protein n=1 Tax=Monilinia fructicola TaxID=38448 RepID=A0A5M9K296_MONFR|nr:hypothetical protein EYC84_004769 [Monilinia fructicola]
MHNKRTSSLGQTFPRNQVLPLASDSMKINKNKNKQQCTTLVLCWICWKRSLVLEIRYLSPEYYLSTPLG